MSRQLVVIDPASHTPEVDTFNLISRMSPIPATYHLPQLLGMGTLRETRDIGGLIVLGSAASVVDEPDWQIALTQWILPHWEAAVPCLAICWGHQWVAHSFGGKVEFLSPEKEKLQGFRHMHFQSKRWLEDSGELFVSHREVVTQLPPQFQQIATSELASVEAMEHESLPIFTLQPHPETTPIFIQNQKAEPPSDPHRLNFGHEVVKAFLRHAAP